MLVWRGKGLLVLVSGMLGGLGVGLISGALESTNMATLLQTGITLIVFGLVSAGINYLFCKYFISKKKESLLMSKLCNKLKLKTDQHCSLFQTEFGPISKESFLWD